VKYAVFIAFALLAVPTFAVLAWWSERWRSWIFSLMVAAPMLGDRANIHFLSVETYRGPDRGFEVTLADLLALSLAAAVTLRRPGRISLWPAGSFWALALFLLAAVSLLDAPAPLLGVFTLFKWAKAWFLYWTVVNAIRTGVPLRALWRGWMMAGVAMILFALYQKYGQGIYRVPTFFDHSNTVPLFLNLGIPVLVAMGLAAPWLKPRQALATLVIALGMLLTVVMTFSRAGMTLSLGVLLGTVWLAYRKVPSRRVTVATLVVALGLIGGLALTGRSIVERFLEAPESSHMAREEFNRAARAMASEHPLGVGVNQFSYVLTNNPHFSRHIVVMAAERQKGVCHHVYWLTAAELGYLGLAFFVVLLLRFLSVAGWQAFRRRGFEGLLQGALLLGMGALHLSGFLEWVFRITPIFHQFLITAGVSVGLASMARPSAGRPGASAVEGEGRG